LGLRGRPSCKKIVKQLTRRDREIADFAADLFERRDFSFEVFGDAIGTKRIGYIGSYAFFLNTFRA